MKILGGCILIPNLHRRHTPTIDNLVWTLGSENNLIICMASMLLLKIQLLPWLLTFRNEKKKAILSLKEVNQNVTPKLKKNKPS